MAATRPRPSTYQERRVQKPVRKRLLGSSYSAAPNFSASNLSSTSSMKKPPATAIRTVSITSDLVHSEHGQEGFLRYLHGPDPLHALLALFLLFQQLPLARNVATVALGKYVFPHRRHGLPRDHIGADRSLDCDFEHLARDQAAQPMHQLPADGLGTIAMDNDGQRIHRLARHENVHLHQVRRPVTDLLVVHRRVALGASLEQVV